MGQSGSCCELAPTEVVSAGEHVSERQQKRDESAVLLQTLPGTAKGKPPGAAAAPSGSSGAGPSTSGKQASFRGLVASQLAERKASPFAGMVLDMALELRLGSGKQAATHILKESEVVDIAFSPDGKSLLLGCEDSSVMLWDIKEKSKRLEAQIAGAVTAVAFAPDGQFFAVGDDCSHCTVWRGTTLDELVSIGSHDGKVLSIALGSWPRSMLAVSFDNGRVKLVSLPDMKTVTILSPNGLMHGLCFSPEGGLLAGGCGAGSNLGLITPTASGDFGSGYFKGVLCWRLPTEAKGKCETLAKLPFEGAVYATAFSPSGRLLAAGSEDRTIKTFLVEGNFEKVASLACPAGVRCLSWSADSRFLASGGEDMQVSVWDLITEKIIVQLPRMRDWLSAVAFSPETSLLACCSFGCEGVSLQPVEVCKVGNRAKLAATATGKQAAPPRVRRSCTASQVVCKGSEKSAGMDIMVSQHYDSSSL